MSLECFFINLLRLRFLVLSFNFFVSNLLKVCFILLDSIFCFCASFLKILFFVLRFISVGNIKPVIENRTNNILVQQN